MRLINTSTYRLEYFADYSHVPGYAILSHTWSHKELLYDDLVKPDVNIATKPGYNKFRSACLQAQEDNLPYIWIDNCCIDKTSSSELSQSLNSMFMWYQNAVRCYVHLSDVSLNYINALASGPTTAGADDLQEGDGPAKSNRDRALLNALSPSRWFTRGWTLQELLAPPHVQFFDRNWAKIGMLIDIIDLISEITRIPLEALHKHTPLSQFSVAKRMSWAAYRDTTIVEDRAYSLLGIFDINMPLLYGEGERSFIRLQKEIVRLSNDHSILIWGGSHLAFFYPRYELFASSPHMFQHCGRVAQLRTRDPRLPFEMTNNGLRISSPVMKTRSAGQFLVLLNCYDERTPHRVLALLVSIRKNGEALFHGRDFQSCSMRTYNQLQRRPRVLIITEHNIATSSLNTDPMSRKILLRFYDARRHYHFLTGDRHEIYRLTLHRVCGQPAWDTANLTWNPHVLPYGLPELITAGFEIVISTTEITHHLRATFSELCEADRNPAPWVQAQIVHPGEANSEKTLKETCVDFETKTASNSTGARSARPRTESSIRIDKNLEVRIVAKGSTGMRSIKVTMRDRPSLLRRSREEARRKWRSFCEERKSNREGGARTHPTVSTSAVREFQEIEVGNKIDPDRIVTRKENRHYLYRAVVETTAHLTVLALLSPYLGLRRCCGFDEVDNLF